MGKTSSIEWTQNPDGSQGASWNPLIAEDRVTGTGGNRWACIKKSPGCERCYASTLNVRYGGSEFAPIGAKEPNAHVVLNRSGRGDSDLATPDRWLTPRTIFVCSMTDWAGSWVSLDDQMAMLDVAMRNHRHTFQFLTKRPDRSLAALDAWLERNRLPCAPPHMWFGTTIEMGSLCWRADVLARHRAAVRFVSAEPLIGHLDLAAWLQPGAAPRFEWLIIGGESGAGARPMHPAWARLLIAQAQAAGVATFLKQWGAWSLEPVDRGRVLAIDPRGREVPEAEGGTTLYWHRSKHEAGRMIDGRTWDEVPERPWMRAAAA